jgi:hypothetical protein
MEEQDLYEDTDKQLEEVLVRNNATIIPMGGSLPIMDYTLYNEEHKIWRGTLVVPQKNAAPIIYFSRKYQPEVNELDQIFVEIEITDPELLGVPFILVPKEKLMFGYDKGSSILTLNPNGPRISKPHMQ